MNSEDWNARIDANISESILAVKYDPWAGLGMDAVSLEDKVVSDISKAETSILLEGVKLMMPGSVGEGE